MATLSNFGEQFAAKVLGKSYQNAVYPAIVNREYEGEIKKPGDRVNILSFLNSILLSDYSVGSDMSSETIIDNEDQLIVEKRKYYNFSLDKLEDLFTYGGDIPESLITDASKVLDRYTDTYVLDKWGSETKAGNWIGIDLLVKSGTELGGTAGTAASIVTSATGGTITIQTYDSGSYESGIGTVTNHRDGQIYFAGFQNADLYKGIRLRSTAAFVTPWYRISAITSSTVCTVTEWDEAVSGSDFEERMTLRGLYGGDGRSFPKYGGGADIADFTTYDYCGWEIQAAIPTAVTASTIYDQITLLAEALDENEVPPEDRKFTVPPQVVTQLRQSAELQPTGIAEIYSGTVINGKAMRVGAFDIFSAAGSRVSTRAGHSPASASTRIGPEVVLTAATTGYILAANHKSFVTFADKWSESRVVEAENQFAKKYQGLYLFGAKVPHYARKYGAVLFGSL